MSILDGVCVLVVDDDMDIVASLVDTLTLLGCRSSGVYDLEGAMFCLERERPDVIICDWNLDEVTSEAFLQRLRARYPSVGRVLFTGSPPGEWQRLVNDGLVQIAIMKPGELAELVAAVATLGTKPRAKRLEMKSTLSKQHANTA